MTILSTGPKLTIHLRGRRDPDATAAGTLCHVPGAARRDHYHYHEVYPLERPNPLGEGEVWCKDCVDALSPLEQLNLLVD